MKRTCKEWKSEFLEMKDWVFEHRGIDPAFTSLSVKVQGVVMAGDNSGQFSKGRMVIRERDRRWARIEIATNCHMANNSLAMANYSIRRTFMHEMAHYIQLYEGRLLKICNGIFQWEGTEYSIFDIPWAERPWEIDAQEKEIDLLIEWANSTGKKTWD